MEEVRRERCSKELFGANPEFPMHLISIFISGEQAAESLGLFLTGDCVAKNIPALTCSQSKSSLKTEAAADSTP